MTPQVGTANRLLEVNLFKQVSFGLERQKVETPMQQWLSFRELKPGERFQFHYYPTDRVSTEVYTKRNSQWFEDANGRKFRTGKLTAVKRVTD